MTQDIDTRAQRIAGHIQTQLAAAADPTKAGPMQAYMKTDMPFYGVQAAARRQIVKAVAADNPLDPKRDHGVVRRSVELLWAMPHREEKYAAITLARSWRGAFIAPHMMDLYEKLIREGAWWDFVDELAIHLVGPCLLRDREHIAPLIEKWLTDDDMWIRRSALLAHNRHKKDTDGQTLLRHCLTLAHEPHFFIRKAIGWALREYSYTAPQTVADFVRQHHDALSKLSRKEATRRLIKAGLWP